ncbi:MAG TPA: AAA family ATPase [Gammaproteobacteria bacterium]|nr:AAA family ATPase [Gammaproteobacteria bacterium]
MRDHFHTLRQYLQSVILGQEALIERLIVGLLAGGHLLLEGMPGLAKTRAVHALASALAMRFKRIQFTPDLIPGDITGSDIFLPREGRFRFVEGPLFNDIILADEINRAPPKVQSALLEAMEERQVTVGDSSRPLSPLFTVIATQNPIEQEGTYPLPEAQLDRFFMKIHIDYPDAEAELAILRQAEAAAAEATPPGLGAEVLTQAQRDSAALYMDEMLARYIVALVQASRQPGDRDPQLAEWLNHGASPRATLALSRAARCLAYLRDRDFVTPDDIMDVAADVLNHRIGLTFAARAADIGPRQVVARLLEVVPAP